MSVLSRMLGLGRDAHYQDGLRAFDAGDYETSAAALERAACGRRDPLTQRLSLFYLAEALSRLGLAALRGGSWARARELLGRALELNPHYADLHLAQGRACRKMGDRAEAEVAFACALEINSHYARAAFYQGLALYENGDRTAALFQMDRAAQADLLLDNAPYRAALAAHEGGNFGQAFLLLEQAAENDEVALLSFAAQEAQRAGRFAEAEMQWRAALSIAPRFADLHNGLGLSLAAQEQWDGAIGEFECALDINPRYGDARKHLAEALKAAGRGSEAEAVRREA